MRWMQKIRIRNTLLSENTKDVSTTIWLKRGYDLKKEREEWYKRIKARGGSI